jgi:hypothetical protein
VDICLIESPMRGTVGVGEGTTPRLREFYTRLDIPESEWMPPCNAFYLRSRSCAVMVRFWSY